MPYLVKAPTSSRAQAWRLASLLLVLALLPLGALYATLTPPVPAAAEPPEGFRQLGQTLIGEIKTGDGRRLTLVLDAKTRTVIGSRLEADTPVEISR